MMYELTPHDYERVRPLFQALDHHLIIRAAIDNTTPAKIYADSVESPEAACICSVEGYFLAGTPTNTAFIASLRDLLRHISETGETLRAHDDAINLAVFPQTWEAALPELFPQRAPLLEHRLKYTCTELRFDWATHIPADYQVHRLDARLLERCAGRIPEHIFEWMQANWGGVQPFLQRGFGFCLLHDDNIVSWCIGDCASGDRCEVGIHTLPDYRRRGLAAIVTAATVADCFERGFKNIGWHCIAGNIGSWKTAEKVGFIKENEYVFHLHLFDDAVYFAEVGWRHLQEKQYADAAEAYARSFALNPDAPHYWYHTAAIAAAGADKTSTAFDYLRRAIKGGWQHFAFTETREEFAALRSLPEWEDLFER